MNFIRSLFRAPIDLGQEDRHQQLLRDLEAFRRTGNLQAFQDAYGVSPYLSPHVIAREVGITSKPRAHTY